MNKPYSVNSYNENYRPIKGRQRDYTSYNKKQHKPDNEKTLRDANLALESHEKQDLQDELHTMSKFKDTWTGAVDQGALQKWDKIFDKIPISDEMFRIPDINKKTQLANNFLHFFIDQLPSWDKRERDKFLELFPWIMDHMNKQLEESLNENEEWALFGLRGAKTREDFDYLYKTFDQTGMPTSLKEKGYISNTKKNLNSNIVKSLMGVSKYGNFADDFSTGHATMQHFDGNEMPEVGKNHYASGIFKRGWKAYKEGSFMRDTYGQSEQGATITNDMFDRFMIKPKDIMTKKKDVR